jgi:CO/xanthine dehydrogenase FAD-binding subunit
MNSTASPQSARSPKYLDEALALRADPRWLVLAGGTDVYPAYVGRSIERPILDLSAIEALRKIEDRVDASGRSWVRLGASSTWTQWRARPNEPGLRALHQAAAEVGGLQIQNQATVGGNLCNASPAADGVPALLALGAEVELSSLRGERRLPLADFVLGNRRTALASDELLTAVEIPRPSGRAGSAFLKLGHRRYLVISVVMVAVQIDLDPDEVISACRIAVGSCSAAARRVDRLEARVVGLAASTLQRNLDRWLVPGGDGVPLIEAAISPIDDVRGTAAYRREAARELIRRALVAALESRRVH